MNEMTISIRQLRDGVAAGDPEAIRRYKNEMMPLLKLRIRQAQIAPAAWAVLWAACLAAHGMAPRAAADVPLSDEMVEWMALRLFQAIVGRAKQNQRGPQHDTAGGRGAWLTARSA